MASVDDKKMSDEEWLVSKAKSYLKNDIYAAKAWLITARTLFPRNFNLQFEAYSIEKGNKNVRHVGKILETMLSHFPQEPLLWQEVNYMIEALQSESSDEKTTFLKDVFGSLPATLQCHMLLKIAESSQDVLARTRLMLLVLKRHSYQIPEHGLKLIDSLLASEKQTQQASAVNCFRKYMVCDVLPLVLRTQLQPANQKQLIRWLQKAVEFFVCYLTLSPNHNAADTPMSPTSDLGSPTGNKPPGYFKPTSKWRISIPGLTEKEAIVDHPLQKLENIVTLVANQLEWKMDDFFCKNSELQWERIMEVHDQMSVQQNAPADSPIVKKLLYSTMVVCFTSIFKYSCGMTPSHFAATCTSNNGPNAVLIEGQKSASGISTEHKSKKLKVAAESCTLHVSGSKNLGSGKEILGHFTTALKCWHILQSSELLQKEFNKLLQHWRSENWLWLKSFEIDVLIYQGQFKEASNKLIPLKNGILKAGKIELELQMACCFYSMGNFSRAVESLLNVVQLLPSGHTSEPSWEQVPLTSGALSPTGRQLHLLVCAESEIMPFVIQLMISCFKEKSIKQYAADDSCLGHMLVLLQFDWPMYEDLLVEVLDKIVRQSNFTYNIFFNYVINIDILEQFAFLKTGLLGKINLDILPISTKAIAQCRTVTRGVNKGVKEDFKIHLEKQVARSNEDVNVLIKNFLLEERSLLQQSLV